VTSPIRPGPGSQNDIGSRYHRIVAGDDPHGGSAPAGGIVARTGVFTDCGRPTSTPAPRFADNATARLPP